MKKRHAYNKACRRVPPILKRVNGGDSCALTSTPLRYIYHLHTL